MPLPRWTKPNLDEPNHNTACHAFTSMNQTSQYSLSCLYLDEPNFLIQLVMPLPRWTKLPIQLVMPLPRWTKLPNTACHAFTSMNQTSQYSLSCLYLDEPNFQIQLVMPLPRWTKLPNTACHAFTSMNQTSQYSLSCLYLDEPNFPIQLVLYLDEPNFLIQLVMALPRWIKLPNTACHVVTSMNQTS